MQLSYARTIHTFQGSSAGPTLPGQQENAIKCLICDPGTRDFELKNPSLFYSLMSRGTTLGKEGGQLSSAIYFDGPNLNPGRVQNLTRNDTGQLSKKANLWKMQVEKLNMGKHDSRMDKKQSNKVFEYGKNTVDLVSLLFKFSL